MLTKAARDKMTADEIINCMKEGNRRFRQGYFLTHDPLAEQKATMGGQHPAAIILGCIDSRAPAEVIMDLGIGYAFNARVAGNVVNEDILGSMEFACKVAGSKVILVMGHTSCGAVKGAIDGVELGNLTGLLTKIRPAIEAVKFEGERSSKNSAFVDAVALKNVELTIASIRERSAVLRDLEARGPADGRIKITGAVYNVETAEVQFLS